MKAHLNIVALCVSAAAAVAAAGPAAAAGCNDQHATCLQRGGSEDRCLSVWHQCRTAMARVSTPTRPPHPSTKLVAVTTRH